MKKLLNIALENRAYRNLLIFSVIAMAFLTVATYLEILAVGVITKEGKGNDIVETLIGFVSVVFPVRDNTIHLAIFIMVVALFKAVMLFTHRFLTRVIVIRVSRDLRQNYFEHIQSLPMVFYQKYNIGSLSSRVVGDSFLIAEAINACLCNYLQTPFILTTSFVLCFLTSWQLSLVIFLGFPVVIFPIVFLAKKVKRVAKQLQQNQERFASVLLDFLAGVMTVKVFAMEEFSLKKYKEQNQNMARLEQKSARYDLSSRPVIHTIGMVFLSIALLVGLHILHLPVAVVLFYCGMLYAFYEPIKKFAEENNRIQQGVAAADRMFEVISIVPQIQDVDGAIDMPPFTDSIEFDNVWFKYDDIFVLKGVSFKIKKGQTVAIVGPTGSGKSTIVQLLPRLYDPQKGEIRIDGRKIKDLSQKSIREQIAFVPQKPFLFLDTVFENIAFGRDFTEGQVVEAAKRAHADEFICKLPKGYKTPLSETGKNLSGGQQQRLAIARALVKQAPILVMDEATSSLDTISELAIKQAIHSLKGEVTQIIIAHRLTTIEDADWILYMEEGCIVAEGTIDTLLSNCQGFRAMWEATWKGAKDLLPFNAV